MNKIFPTKLPYITENTTFIPDDMVLSIQLIGNDLMYLIAYHSLKNPKTTNKNYAQKMLDKCKKSRTSEWRRKKRLNKKGLL